MAAVPQTRTPLTMEDVVSQLRQAADGLGLNLDNRALALLAGIIGIENAQGKAIIQHNWGNVMATPDWMRTRDWWERPHKDARQPQRFRAYSSHHEGANQWLGLLKRRHPGALREAAKGDAQSLSDSLFSSSYIVAVTGPKAKPEAQQRDEYYRGILGTARNAARLIGMTDAQLASLDIHPSDATTAPGNTDENLVFFSVPELRRWSGTLRSIADDFDERAKRAEN